MRYERQSAPCYRNKPAHMEDSILTVETHLFLGFTFIVHRMTKLWSNDTALCWISSQSHCIASPIPCCKHKSGCVTTRCPSCWNPRRKQRYPPCTKLRRFIWTQLQLCKLLLDSRSTWFNFASCQYSAFLPYGKDMVMATAKVTLAILDETTDDATINQSFHWRASVYHLPLV